MAKPLLQCIGKFIKSNVRFDTLIETGTFDVKTAEEVFKWYPLCKIISQNVNTASGVTKTKMECFLEKN